MFAYYWPLVQLIDVLKAFVRELYTGPRPIHIMCMFAKCDYRVLL